MNYFQYTRDDGSTHYSIKVETDIANKSGLGFGSASASDPPEPHGFKPRVVYVVNTASGRHRAVPVSTPGAYATLLAGGATITLEDKASAVAPTWNVTNGRGEHFSRGTVPHLIH
jgi:hypothetical protein